MKILVTGANGFIGRALLPYLNSLGYIAIPVVRRPCGLPRECIVNDEVSLAAALIDCAAIIHLAGRAHVMKDRAPDPLVEFRAVNLDATIRIARQAADAGVKRFIFVSSVKVNGEYTGPRESFSECDEARPEDPYAQSKYEAEVALRKIGADSAMEITIVRPPLVYGPGARANFAALMHAVQKGWPLPLACVGNQRSLIALDNLVSFLLTCIEHPHAANQTFLVSDGQDVSVAQLVRGLAKTCGRPARLLPVPVWVLKSVATLLGKQDSVRRLCTDLRVDISKARDVLGWIPPVTMEEGLRRSILGMGKG